MRRLAKRFARADNRTKQANSATSFGMALLQGRYYRQKREEVQQLLGSWDVSQKAKCCKRKNDEVKADLISEVVEEARRLKRMQDAYEPPSLDASATTAGICFSAIQTALQHESIER